MYDSLSRMYEGRNINRNMNLRDQLKSTKMSHGESIQEYFTRVSQIKEKLEAVGDKLDEDELVMAALNVSLDPGNPSSRWCVPEKKAWCLK